MLKDILAFTAGMALICVCCWFLYNVFDLERKEAQERKERQDELLKTLDYIRYDLSCIAQFCSSISFDITRFSDTLDDNNRLE